MEGLDDQVLFSGNSFSDAPLKLFSSVPPWGRRLPGASILSINTVAAIATSIDTV